MRGPLATSPAGLFVLTSGVDIVRIDGHCRHASKFLSRTLDSASNGSSAHMTIRDIRIVGPIIALGLFVTGRRHILFSVSIKRGYAVSVT
jgi:hypothetical protein